MLGKELDIGVCDAQWWQRNPRIGKGIYCNSMKARAIRIYAHTGLMDDHPIGIVTFGGHDRRVNQPPYDPATRHLRG